MSARASFSSDSRIVNISLPKSLLLKDHLLDDQSSCSSNGFRSYPRRQCCTKVRYLIEIDLNKHVKLPSTQKQLVKTRSKPKSKAKSKSKSSSLLHKASAAVVNVFKSFNISNSGFSKTRKGKYLLPRNLSRKLSKHGFRKKTVDQNKKEFQKSSSFDEPIKQKKNVLPPASKQVTVETKTTTSNCNSSASADSYFTATTNSSTTGGSSKINVADNIVEERDKSAMEKMNTGNEENTGAAPSTDTIANGNAQIKLPSEEKDHFSPISVMDFPHDNSNGNDNEDEVTSPFHSSYLYVEGCKRKLMPKAVQRMKNLKPLRLEDRITTLETKTHDESCLCELEENVTRKKAIALLQLFRATMPSDGLSESATLESFLLEFFTERVIEGNYSNYAVLQDAKDWVNGVTRDMFEGENYKVAYIRDMEKGVKWLRYDEEVENGEVVSEVEYEIFTSLVGEMVLDL